MISRSYFLILSFSHFLQLPSFSPKPLAPAKQDSKEAETPAWRTGLRKTGSTILPESKKPDERLPRSASAPKIAEQKTNTDNKVKST